LIFTDGLSPDVTHGLFILSLASGSQTQLTFPPPQYDDLAPTLSPDGTKLAFIRCAGRTSGDVYVLPLSANAQPLGSPERVTFLDR
jgi:Tol biopolymer transport system component